MNNVTAFIIGVFIGANLGFLAISLCVAAKKGDEIETRNH